MLRYQSNARPQYRRVSSGEAGWAAVVTVEASFAVPLFLIVCFLFLSLIEIQTVRSTMYYSLVQAAKTEASDPVYRLSPVVNIWSLKKNLQTSAGSSSPGFGLLSHALGNADCFGSYIEPDGTTLVAKVNYTIPLPFHLPVKNKLKFHSSVRIRLWFGGLDQTDTENDDEIVYITDHGLVYHRDRQCTYLKLSIATADAASVKNKRNRWGGKYHACELCTFGPAPLKLFITDQGTKYHYRLDCSGLKRSIRSIRLSETGFRRPCSKCCQ